MHWILTANYTAEAMKAIGKNPSNRREAADKLITAAGGKLISFYRTLSDGPGVVIIFDADPIAAAAINAVAVAGGAIMNVKFTPAMERRGRDSHPQETGGDRGSV